MKVDTNRLKKGTSEVPPECQQLIDRLRQCTRQELIKELSKIETWTFGKCELYHWIDILDIFDGILEEATEIKESNEWCLACDMSFSEEDVKLLLLVLNFTTLLIEHSFSRHLYNSVEHLTRLLSSSNMEIVLGVLNLLYMFSKRSNFISRLNSLKKNSLLTRLNQIAESWGGKEYGFGLANCCKENIELPTSASTFFYEYYNNEGTLDYIEIPDLDKCEKHPAELAKEICAKIDDLDDDQKMHIFTRIRLSSSFHKYSSRLQFVQARLQALSVLVYSNSLQENIHTLLYPGFLEELVELLEMKDHHLVEIRAAALRTLTSIIHLDRNPHFPKKPGSRLGMIIDVTGASSYHGFLPTLVRTCIQNLTTTTPTIPTTNLSEHVHHQQKQLQQLQLQQQQGTTSTSTGVTSSISSSPSPSSASSSYGTIKHFKFQQQLPLSTQLQLLQGKTPLPASLINPFPLPLATALFSFLYHLASYEAGGEALVSCGMMESLLRVINWPGYELEHITFVTRAVRVIDLITNIEMQSFQNHGGLNSFIGRLDMEVNFCRREQPFEIEPLYDGVGGLTSGSSMSGGSGLTSTSGGSQNTRDDSIFVNDDTNMSTDDVHPGGNSSQSSSSYSSTAVKISTPNLSSSLSFEHNSCNSTSSKTSKNLKTCLPQRAALLKSMLNFLKKAIQDPAFTDSIRHVMEGTLPSSLRHIISNAEYYGPSLFLLATDVVTVYVFQEPSLLSSLQDNGLTDVVLQALLKKDVPATREVLGSLPNVFSALCLNARGLTSFVKYDPFERLFKVLLSPVYLMAMRRRRSSDPMGDTASNLGNAMDELMRHQPSLKPEAIKGIIKLLEELVNLGTDPKYICWRATTKNEPSALSQSRHQNNIGPSTNDTAGTAGGSSDEEDDDEEEASTSSHHNQREEPPPPQTNHRQDAHHHHTDGSSSSGTSGAGDPHEHNDRQPIPLIDYILNAMKFVDAILSNNSTDDHCREFVAHGGLKPLLSILALPNLPVDSPITASAQAVAAVCKSILNLAHEPQVLQVALEQLAVVVDQLKPLQVQIESPGGSVLLRELANCPNIDSAFSDASYTPLLHGMSAVHGYIVMLVHICRTGQSEIRNLLLTKWGQDTRCGKKLLKNLVQLYTALVWESTLLLALCTDDIFPYNCEFGKEDIEKLPSDPPADDNTITIMPDTNLIAVENNDNTMDIDGETGVVTADSDGAIDSESENVAANGTGEKKKVPKKLLPSPGQLKYIKALLGASSRLGRALAELFGNLVKLCVGSPIRQRRGQNFPPTPGYTRAESKYIARVLSYILVDGFSYGRLPPSPIPKLKLTFLICSVGFTGPMLFDEKRYAFHLMLHKFVEEGGLEAFFEMFRWAITAGHTIPFNRALEVQHFPDGTGEFLDAWLMLLEKMVNPKAILESPHVINSRSNGRSGSNNKSEFDAALYLINIHRLAFEAVQQIWGMAPLPTYGVRMTESIMTIFKHILKGEKVIKDKMKKRSTENTDTTDRETSAGVSGNASFTGSANNVSNSVPSVTNNDRTRAMSPIIVNQQHLIQLMDMGFSSEHVTEALLHTASVEQATEYLLNHPPPPPPPLPLSDDVEGTVVVREVSGGPMEVDAGDHNDYCRAMNSIENGGTNNSDEQQTKSINSGITVTAPIAGTSKDTDKPSKRRSLSKYDLTTDPPIPEEIFVEFSTKAVDKCLRLMDQLPDTVVKGTELLAILYRKNGDIWKTQMLDALTDELKEYLQAITKGFDTQIYDMNFREKIYNSPLATKFQVRLHIFCLFLDEMYSDIRIPAIQALKSANIIASLVNLLRKVEITASNTADFSFNSTASSGTPKWLSQLIIFLDLYEKVAVYVQRKSEMHKVTTRIWKWYDIASGKWNAYSVSNNKIINDAYWSGESSVRISCGRQRYSINFNSMSQVNEETGNHRPIILALKATENQSKHQPNDDTLISLVDYDVTESDADYDDEDDDDDGGGGGGGGGGDGATGSDANASANTTADGTTTQQPQQQQQQQQQPQQQQQQQSQQNENKIKLTKTQLTGGESGPSCSKSSSSTARPQQTRFESDFNTKLVGLEEFETSEIVTCLVRLMSPQIGVDRDTLHAIMKLLVRLTKSFENAEIFALEGGVKRLLNMKQKCGYIGFPTLSILLIRHVIEEPKTLSLAMERVIAARTMQSIPPGYRDLVFLLRQMSSAISRDLKIFQEVAQSMLRVDISVLRRNAIGEDQRLLLKSVQNAKRTETMEEPVSIQVVHDLLKALIIPWPYQQQSQQQQSQQCNNKNDTTATTTTTPTNMMETNTTTIPFHHVPEIHPSTSSGTNGNSSANSTRHHSSSRNRNSTTAAPTTTTTATPTTENDSTGGTSTNANKDHCCGWHVGPCVSHEYGEPLLPRARILKFLADAVRSYQTFAPLITDYVYKAGDSTIITENTSVLSFIIDKLLPHNDQYGDREVSSMSRVLISALASCSEQASVQYTVVSEVKAAIMRALALPESADKHSQLQLLAGLIPIMIDNCPLENPSLLKLHHLQPRRSDIFYIMVRKGLITDLAKLTQYLDLSSPHTIATVNAAMKPLETLLRMTNQPGPVPLPKSKKTQSSRRSMSNTNSSDEQLLLENTSARSVTTTDIINAQNNLLDDTDNTDQDLAAAVIGAVSNNSNSRRNNDIPPLLRHPIVVPPSENPMDLNVMMEEFLERCENEEVHRAVTGRDENEEFNNVVLETSSESADTDSNASDNDEREIEDEDENEDEAEDRSEIDVDEETRQFIEIYDHVYTRHMSPDLMTTSYPRTRIRGAIQTENETSSNRINVSGDRTGNTAGGGTSGNASNSPSRLMTFQVNIPGILETIANNRPVMSSSGTSSNNINGSQSASQDVGGSNDDGGIGESSSSSMLVDPLGGEPSSSSSSSSGGGGGSTRIRININSATGNSGNISTSTNITSPTTSSSHQHHHHIHSPSSRSISSNISSGPSIGVPYNSSSGNGSGASGVNNSAAAGITVSVSTMAGQHHQPSMANSSSQISIGGGTGNNSSQAVAGGNSGNSGNSSISQRLVAFTRTLRNQLGTAESNPPSNVRQRRYQLLSLNSRNTPIILQRLLGPGNAVQNNSSSGVQESGGAGGNGDTHNSSSNTGGNNNAFRDATRVVLMDNAFGIFSNTDEGSIDLVDQAGYLFGRSLAATLSNTPTALHWWLEEAKALGLESQSDICLTVANNLIPQLEMQKSLEVAKIRGKKKKKQTDDDKSSGTGLGSDSASSRMADGDDQKMEKDEDNDLLIPMESNNDTENQQTAVSVNTMETMTTDSQQISGGVQQQTSTTPGGGSGSSSSHSLQSSQGGTTDAQHDSNSSGSQQNTSGATAARATSSFFMRNYPATLPEHMFSADLTELANAALLSMTSPVFTDSEDLDSTLMSREERLNTTATTNDEDEQENENDDEDEDDDDEEEEEENEDDEDIVNNTSDEEEPDDEDSSDIGDLDINLFGRFSNSCRQRHMTSSPPILQSHGGSGDDDRLRAIFNTSPPVLSPHLNYGEQNIQSSHSARDGETLARTSANDSTATTTLTTTTTTTAARTIASTGLRNNRQEGTTQVTQSTQRQPITDEEMEAAVLIPLPIEDDEDEELDDILEILTHTTTSLTSTTTTTTTTNNTTATTMRTTSSSSSSTTARGSGTSSNVDNSSTVTDQQAVSNVGSGHITGTDDFLTNTQNRTNETQEEEASIVGANVSIIDISSDTIVTEQGVPLTNPLLGNNEQNALGSTAQQSQQQPIPDEIRNLLGDLEVPEGVDPSFLAALPYEMREEVISEHLRLQRIRQRAQQNAIQVEHASVVEVNPEFLAALPPNIQEEVLAQQRIEQQRQAAAAANPNDPVDAAAFFQNLQPSLRQAILTDMEDSQISVLPPELAAEAQNLRRDWENRNRQMMQERLLNQIGSSAPNMPSVRYMYRRGPRFPGHIMRPRWTNWNMNSNSGESNSPSLMTLMERQGRPLLDYEALTSLLTLLFIDEPKFNTLRLHRVIRNLCCHVPTREWIIKALLSIIERCNLTTTASGGSGVSLSSSVVAVRPQWLNIRLNAALGSRANVFVIKKDLTQQQQQNNSMMMESEPSTSSSSSTTTSSSPSSSSTSGYIVSIHPQASQIVCKHTLDLLITLAKSFPKNFLPYKKQITTTTIQTTTATIVTQPITTTTKPMETEKIKKQQQNTNAFSCNTSASTGNNAGSSGNAMAVDNQKPSCSSADTASIVDPSRTDFWDIIVKLDCTASQRKANGPIGRQQTTGTTATGSSSLPPPIIQITANNKDIVTFDESPFGQLISMLSFDIVRKSSQLTDKLLRLLSFISVGLPDEKSSSSISSITSSTSSHAPPAPGSVATTTSDRNPTETGSAATNFCNASAVSNTPNNDERKNIEEIADTIMNDGTASSSVNESLLPNSENQLRLAIEVLTSKSCSEEGLEDATSLLLNMSQCSNQTRTIILNLLIRGAKDLAKMVEQQIKDLMVELRELNNKNEISVASTSSGAGVTNNNSPSPPGNEISPSNDTGTAATSASASGSCVTAASLGTNASTSTGTKPKGMLQDRFTKETVVITAPTKVKQTCELQLSSMVPLIAKTSSQGFFLRVLKVIIQIREAVREANCKIENRGRIVLGPNELTPLSETLNLDDLWNTLSECLLELEDTADNHAVLVLQPAVEAFFLVHASQQQKPPPSSSSSSQTSSAYSRLQEQQRVDAATGVGQSLISIRNSLTPASSNFENFRIDGMEMSSNNQVNPNDTTTSESSPLNISDLRPMQQDDDENDEDDDINSINSDGLFNAALSTVSSKSILSSSTSSFVTAIKAKESANSDQKKFLQFAEKHRTVLNQILRQTTTHLADGPFAVLVDHTRILDFDVKRRYFRTELERLDEGIRREELAVHVHRVTVFEDSFRELYRRNPEEWKNRFYIVFEDEEGQDAGGLLREWYVIISREIFNPMYALFTVSPGDRVTYMINPSSHANPNHLCYYKFVGRVIAKAIYDNKLLECYFTRSFYKHILGIQVKYTDMESEDYEFYKGLVFLLENHISALGYELTFSLEVQEFGVTEIRDLIANGRNIPVTEENKLEYIRLVCQLKMSGSIRQQLNAFLEGFYDIIPKRLISIFNEQELELLISGLPNVDIEDLKANTEYHKYQANSIQIQWFWRALRSFDQADRAKFLQFVTGTSKVPLQGFAALEGMNGTQKFQIHRDDRSTDRLPSAHTCFNQLDLPVYKTYDKLRSSLLKAIHECSEGFGFA